MQKVNNFKEGNLEFGQSKNGMYWSQLKDKFGDVIRARTGLTLKEVLEDIEEENNDEKRL